MKLSVEAKVAAIVAIAFAALSIGAIAQEGSKDQSVRLSQTSGSEISLAEQGANGEGQLLAQY